MKNILMIGSALMAGCAGFDVLPAQEFSAQELQKVVQQIVVQQIKDAKGAAGASDLAAYQLYPALRFRRSKRGS